jgi:hypothetical protein
MGLANTRPGVWSVAGSHRPGRCLGFAVFGTHEHALLTFIGAKWAIAREVMKKQPNFYMY